MAFGDERVSELPLHCMDIYNDYHLFWSRNKANARSQECVIPTNISVFVEQRITLLSPKTIF